MTKKTKTILLVLAGVAICAVVVVVGTAVWIFTSAVSSATADEPTALKTLGDVRARFEGVAPLIDLRPDGPVLTRVPAGGTAGERLQWVQVLAWDRDDQKLSRVTLPFWLLRLKAGPLDLASEAGVESGLSRVSMTVDEIERYGPALLVDHTERDGTRVLVWTE